MSLKYWGLVCITGLLLTGCDYNRSMPSTQIPTEQSFSMQGNQPVVSGVYPVSNMFDKIAVMGLVSATINGHGLQNQVTAEGGPRVTNQIKVWEKNRILYIANQHNHPVNIVITSDHPIQELSFLGNGKFDIKDIGQLPMNLNLSGNTQTKMDGNFVLQKVTVRDNAKLKAYWVNSSRLRVMASDKARIFLGGLVTNLDINASGQAIVNGKYLQAENSYVIASQQSQVGVNAKNALGTQSFDSASVYYYKDPQMGGIYLNDSGSALRMQGILNHSNRLMN